MNLEKGNESLEQSLTISIAKSDLRDVTLSMAELGLDSFMVDGIAKSLPFFDSFYKLIKTGIGIKEAIYFKKVVKYLLAISEVSEDERREFVAELEKDERKKRKFQEVVLVILDRLDYMEKSTIIGRLSKALIQKHIDFSTWQRLCHMVDRTFIVDLNELPNYYIVGTGDEEIGEILVANGLMNLNSTGDERANFGAPILKAQPIFQNKYYLNRHGKLLVDFGLNE